MNSTGILALETHQLLYPILTPFFAAHYHIFIGDISPEINDEALSKAFGVFGTMTYVPRLELIITKR